MRSEQCREIEKILGLEKGWMDHDHSEPLAEIANNPYIRHVVERMLAMEKEEQYTTSRVVDSLISPAGNDHDVENHWHDHGKRPVTN